MPVYTLIITTAVGRQVVTLSDFPDDQIATSDAGKFVSSEHPSLGLARGSGDQAEFLGAWDWSDGRACWTPEE
jgi:hypothetical protein